MTVQPLQQLPEGPALLAVVFGKWDVFDRAMDDTRRTIRLAVLLLAAAAQPAAVAALVYFLGRR